MLMISICGMFFVLLKQGTTVSADLFFLTVVLFPS